MTNTIRAWHFTAHTLRDGRPIPRKGVWLKYEDEVSLCNSGLHASREPFDALTYAPGAILHLVEVRQVVEEQGDKLVARQRRIVASMDATGLMHYFARMQALSVVHLYPNGTDDVVFDWLMTDNPSLRKAARSAACAAARAARSVEASAAWAACAAARPAACAAARSASCAARSASWAAKSSARSEFNRYVFDSFRDYL